MTESFPGVLPLDAFKMCREEVKHEYNVLTGRLTTYITSQAFLVNAYAVSMNNTNSHWGTIYQAILPSALCIFGFLLTLQAYFGIDAVCKIIQAWHAHQLELLDAHPELDHWTILGQSNIRHVNSKSLTFARYSTWIFGLAWILMGGIAFWMTLLSGK